MLKTAGILGNHMVLQQGKAIPVWGTAEPSAEITVSFDGNTVRSAADRDGKWKLVLPEHAAGSGFCMTVSNGMETICYTDVCVGEVWLAGGQSNMEYLLGFEKHIDLVLMGEMDPMIRCFTQPQISYEGQEKDFEYRNEGFWRGCTREDLPYFSAAGYYFAKMIRTNQDVPVGIVACNWGGTPACAWMDPDYLRGTEGESWVTEYEEATCGLDAEEHRKAFVSNPANDRTNMLHDGYHLRVVKIGLNRQEQLAFMAAYPDKPPMIGPCYERRPGGLYETMLKKVHPYGIRGVIWYQGETDSDTHGHQYATVFSQMIRNWRDLWGEELPFLFVQLAPFYRWMGCVGTNYPIVRQQQEIVSKTVPGTWMASIGDAGMKWDIHPKDKKTVGNRLGLLARHYVYGEDIACDAPEFESAVQKEDEISIRFANGERLCLQDDYLSAMVGITEQGEEIALTEGAIRDGALVVKTEKPLAELRFAWSEYYEVNLYNGAGLPAKPFRCKL